MEVGAREACGVPQGMWVYQDAELSPAHHTPRLLTRDCIGCAVGKRRTLRLALLFLDCFDF